MIIMLHNTIEAIPLKWADKTGDMKMPNKEKSRTTLPETEL